jgi:hypothetical protein
MKKIAVISMVGGVLLIIAAAIPFGLSRRTAPADLQENAAQQGQIENREPVHTPRPFLPRPEPQPTAETEDTPTASRSLFDQNKYRLLIIGMCFMGMLSIISFRMIWYRKGGRGYRRLEAEANAAAHEIAGKVAGAMLKPISATVGMLGDMTGAFAGAFGHLNEVTRLLGSAVAATMVCWEKVIVFMGEGRFYDAALAIADDHRVASLLAHKNLIQAIYKVAMADPRERSCGEAMMIRQKFPFVLETLPPIPVPSESDEAPAKT